MMILKMVVVSLVKHRLRTVLIVFAVLISVFVMEVVAGMFQGIRANFFETLTREGGHVEVTAEGYRERLRPFPLDRTIEGYEVVVTRLEALPGVRSAEEVVQFGTLLQHGDRDVTLVGVGVREDTGLYGQVGEGMVHGEFPPREGGIVISRSIADLLRAELRSEVLLVVEDRTGSPFYLQYPVTGVFETAARDFDDNTVFLTHRDARELLYLEDRTTEIRVRLDDPERAEEFVVAAQASAGGDDLVYRTWREAHSGLVSMIEMMDFFVLFMNVFVVIVAASVITNAILMNVFDRIREFGTLRAIGLKRRGVAGIILTEGVVQGIAGSVLGVLLGVPVVLYFSVNGLDWGGISEMFGMGSSVFRFAYTPRNSVINGLSGIAIAVAGSGYAALVGARLSIMDALRYE